MPLDIDGAGRSRSLACLPTARGTVAPTKDQVPGGVLRDPKPGAPHLNTNFYTRRRASTGLQGPSGASGGLQGPCGAFRAFQESLNIFIGVSPTPSKTLLPQRRRGLQGPGALLLATSLISTKRLLGLSQPSGTQMKRCCC